MYSDTAVPVCYEGVTCTFAVERPAAGVVVLRLAGWDAGEFGSRPMQELERDLGRNAHIELFIDARDVRGATIDVSSEWSLWLGRHRARFRHINMLAGSRLIEVTADFVRRFAALESMRVYTDAEAFDAVLARTIAAKARGCGCV